MNKFDLFFKGVIIICAILITVALFDISNSLKDLVYFFNTSVDSEF
ncbi:hypothetical protein M3221_24385 [Domibacillus indicus]|nr:hypothetical protein [Domibacillus indicus]MCM3791465.1 hypothetical protein [Domibacillus indicus]